MDASSNCHINVEMPGSAESLATASKIDQPRLSGVAHGKFNAAQISQLSVVRPAEFVVEPLAKYRMMMSWKHNSVPFCIFDGIQDLNGLYERFMNTAQSSWNSREYFAARNSKIVVVNSGLYRIGITGIWCIDGAERTCGLVTEVAGVEVWREEFKDDATPWFYGSGIIKIDAGQAIRWTATVAVQRNFTVGDPPRFHVEWLAS